MCFRYNGKTKMQTYEDVKQKYQLKAQTQIFKASSLTKSPQPAAISNQK